ncbi:sensor histidine kinase [Ideonella sp. BN130291]|uniref:sensor histidine kinase n=1 Tax=Ideonella sp. BN130291 TaxID=3112940 RepID=UPI002E257D32|nr:sensor histidine kinase [Ideonella sp. BN130291]
MIARQSAAAEALQALGELVLLIDLGEEWLPWCSGPAQELLSPLRVGAPLAQVCQRVIGLRALLDAPPAGGCAIAALQVDGRHFDATLASAGDQRVAVRLCDAGERERAMQRHLEDRERLLFTSRAVSVGEMASTLAHELNQPIGAIANLLRGVRMRMAREAAADNTGTELQRAVERATEQALFAGRIIARIREYTQSRQPRREAFDLGATVRASVQLLDWELQRDGVQCVLQLPEAEPLMVEGDEVMLQQVFVNLVRNALDAMRGVPPGQPRTLSVQARAQGTQAEVAIADTGCGLTDDAAAQLFVPFVSTKPTGMGIGLNICRSFVELHQGRLWFERRSPTGCSFNVALPLKETTHHDATDAVHR